ncbi:hypothetical protein M011DRAFT_260622 [Sporormia fimetaria CBS 119925]|uniref:Uncharacterized protein n=1 Tax=Sporormia fimetaria CBS 119925 TaxID=1340428 RepID=A0A6A6V081_9PLEO|nr:hypothetical protein M011DRAFT_260622 [Sporormia fimetaria CBS 119925]
MSRPHEHAEHTVYSSTVATQTISLYISAVHLLCILVSLILRTRTAANSCPSEPTMCWITLPPRGKNKSYRQLADDRDDVNSTVYFRRRERYTGVPSILQLVRPVTRVHYMTPAFSLPPEPRTPTPRYTGRRDEGFRIQTIHPLRAHPLKLHGPGKPRLDVAVTQPWPREREQKSSPLKEPMYHFQPIAPRREPFVDEIRRTTRVAIKEIKPERKKLRRVAGYEVLSKQVPWSWDCMSKSTQ